MYPEQYDTYDENDKFVKKQVNDPVNHPTHYTYGNIECIDFIDSCGYGFDFCIANAIKYLCRCKHKNNTLEDMEKARWYIDHAIQGWKDKKYEDVRLGK